jgi:hypothetical protein
MTHRGLNQLLCAAVVDDGFCQTLLRDPRQAIARGYLNQRFALTAEERDLLTSIQAQRLEDLAAKVYGWVSGSGSGNGHGHGQPRGW